MTNKNFLQNFTKFNYMDYSSDNYGAHSIAIELNQQRFYFSYDTLVAFKGYDKKGNYYFCVRQNEWGSTTGKHLNAINPNKQERLTSEEFEKQLKLFLK